jgi:hypothetical protein
MSESTPRDTSVAEQLTQAQAIAFGNNRAWETMTFEERARFQLYQGRLCMPFPVFHEAITKALGRDVWTHEFARPDLLKTELAGDAPAPTMQNILDLIPAEKWIVIFAPED